MYLFAVPIANWPFATRALVRGSDDPAAREADRLVAVPKAGASDEGFSLKEYFSLLNQSCSDEVTAPDRVAADLCREAVGFVAPPVLFLVLLRAVADLQAV